MAQDASVEGDNSSSESKSSEDVEFLLGIDEWVAARGPSLVRFAYLVTGNANDAQDAVQDALVSIYPHWSRLQSLGTVEAYVRRVIVNRHISRWRAWSRHETSRAEPEAGLGARHEPDAVADLADTQADAALAWQLCATLPRAQRAAVVLRFYEDQSFAQIAEVLGCSESTARSHVHRALATLRIHLREAGDHA